MLRGELYLASDPELVAGRLGPGGSGSASMSPTRRTSRAGAPCWESCSAASARRHGSGDWTANTGGCWARERSR